MADRRVLEFVTLRCVYFVVQNLVCARCVRSCDTDRIRTHTHTLYISFSIVHTPLCVCAPLAEPHSLPTIVHCTIRVQYSRQNQDNTLGEQYLFSRRCVCHLQYTTTVQSLFAIQTRIAVHHHCSIYLWLQLQNLVLLLLSIIVVMVT